MEYGLKAVSAYLGVPADTVRKWEARYDLVSPERRANGYRAYCAADLERLQEFAARRRKGLKGADAAKAARRVRPALPSDEPHIKQVMGAICAFDRVTLQAEFERSVARLGLERAFDRLWLPVMTEIGARDTAKAPFWIAAEHFASGFLREQLVSAVQRGRPEGRPRLALAAPAGDRHELGMLSALCRLETAGVRCVYLGPDLPAKALHAALARLSVGGAALTFTVERSRADARALLGGLSRRFPGLKVYLCGRGSLRHANLARELGAIFLGTDLARGVARAAADLGADSAGKTA
jgi:DNA-binding transcriptional MerR regulator